MSRELNEAPPQVAKARLLRRGFFARDPRCVAQELLGMLLVRREGGELLVGRVVETEAYLGQGDLAAHAAAGTTARNRVLFGPPAHAYVYLIYGNHFCLNVSCLPEGEAGCVLLRALEPVSGIAQMALNRGVSRQDKSEKAPRLLTSGPGRLTQALGITRARDNGKDMVVRSSDLVFMDDGFRPAQIAVTPRIGITKSVENPLRYLTVGNPFVSGKRFRHCK